MAAQSKVAPLPPWGYAVAGSTGAVLANALVYPLDIVKTRIQVQVKKRTGGTTQPGQAADEDHYDGTVDALQKIMKQEGVAGLYSGMASSLLGVASTNFAFFYWFTFCRSLYLSSQTVPTAPGTIAELSIGAVAGALAQLFTLPVAVITTRQQTQNRYERKGFLDTGKEVVAGEDGWPGLWRGLKASLVLVVNPSITYGAYMRLKTLLFPNVVNLAPWQSFLLGALSKSLATIATQPLIVAKVGLQSKPPPAREGKPFKSFIEVMAFIIEHEGLLGLFKGIVPQISKGIMVQGILMMTKERMELAFILLFRYVRKIRDEKLKKIAEAAAEKAQQVAPAVLK